ncbi:serine threonine-protein, partial [Cystoisospora suis]
MSSSAAVSLAVKRDSGNVLRHLRVLFKNSRHRGVQRDWSMFAWHGLSQQRPIPKEIVGDSRSAEGVGLAGPTGSEGLSHVRNSRHPRRDEFTGWRGSSLLVHGRSEPHSSWAQHILLTRDDPRQMISMVSEKAVARFEGQRSSDLPQTSRDRAGRGRSGSPDPWVVPRNVRVKRSELQQGRLDLAKLAGDVLSGEMERAKIEYRRGPTSRHPAARAGLKARVRQGDSSDSGVGGAFRTVFPNGAVYNARDEDEKFRRVGVGKLLGVGASGVVSLVQDMTNMAAARNFAGKFFYVALKSDAPHHIAAGERKLDRSLGREVEARKKALSRADVKPHNTSVDPATGDVYLVDLEFIREAGTDQGCGHYMTIHYADPERARCYIEGRKHFEVTEWVDSWALGVSLVGVLCDAKLPFGESPIILTDRPSTRNSIVFEW